MSRISSTRRAMQIKIKQKRKKKLAGLRQKYLKASFSQDKNKILKKVQKLAPWLTKEGFLAPIKEKSKKG